MSEISGKKSVVAVVPCDTYDEEKVYGALRKGVELLGGIGAFVKPEERILVKPNFLLAADADKAATTHPAVMRGMFRLLQEEGYAHVLYGDSPGHGSCKGAAERLGLAPENCYGAQMADMSHEVLTPFPDGMTAKEFHFVREVGETDAIINLCKMKTHSLERVTGAVKNLYGLICGYRKAAGHVKFPNATVFARALADIHRCVKPRLHVMDGIMAMEGNGPGSGTPTLMKVLLFSADPVALDTVFCHLVHLDPKMVPTNTQGASMGIGTCLAEEISVLVPDEGGSAPVSDEGGSAPAPGREISMEELVKRYGNPDFDVDRQGGSMHSVLGRYSQIMTSFTRRPVIDKKKCIRCGICVSHCPVPAKAIDFRHGKDQPPVYDYKKCIRCYCCQEMCPQSAIRSRRHQKRK